PCATATPASGRRIVRGNVAAGGLGAAAEEELLHLPLQELAGLGLDRRQPVLVDQHRLVREPALPGLLRDVVENALPELAGIGGEVQPLRFPAEQHAVDGSCHRYSR